MSMVMQRHLDYYDNNGTIHFYRLVDEYLAAKKKDIEEGNVDCEHEDKVQRIQEITGVDLREI